MDKDGFFAAVRPDHRRAATTRCSCCTKTCCWWSGQSWPYATSQTLKAMANLLQDYDQDVVTQGRLPEAAADLRARRTARTASRTSPRRATRTPARGRGTTATTTASTTSTRGFNDLVITGLVGLRPRDDDTLEVEAARPGGVGLLRPGRRAVPGRLVGVVWDRTARATAAGKGLHAARGRQGVAASDKLGPLTAKLPAARSREPHAARDAGQLRGQQRRHVLPARVGLVHRTRTRPPSKLIDGNYWYHRRPAEPLDLRGLAERERLVSPSTSASKRPIDTVKLYFLDDGEGRRPAGADRPRILGRQGVEARSRTQTRTPEKPTGHRANVIRFPAVETQKLRAVFTTRTAARPG